MDSSKCYAAFQGWTSPYYVRLVICTVDSDGRTGDFDSTKTPTVRLESDHTIRQLGRAAIFTPNSESSKT